MASLREQVRDELLGYWKNKDGFDKYKYSDDYKYYVKEVKDNLFGEEMSSKHLKMFENGSGSELEDKKTPAKAKAIDSSSMLSYNFFRNIDESHPLEIDEIEYDKVFFEVKLRTLKTRSNPANIDVVLVSKDKKTILFIESKFLEYIESGSAYFSESYTSDDYNLYYYEDNKERETLHKMSKNFMNEPKCYNYGFKQNICHLIGISNLKKSKKARKKFEKLYDNKKNKEIYKDLIAAVDSRDVSYKFMNIIFCPQNEKALQKCNNYIKKLQSFTDKISLDLPQYIGCPFIMTYKELFDKLPEKLSVKKELKERYINYHSEKEWK